MGFGNPYGDPWNTDIMLEWTEQLESALKTLKGVYGSAMVTHEGSKRHIFDIALEFMLADKINAEVLVTHTFNLDDYMEMIDVNMNKGKHKAIKTLVDDLKRPHKGQKEGGLIMNPPNSILFAMRPPGRLFRGKRRRCVTSCHYASP